MNPAKINTPDRLHTCDNSAMFAMHYIHKGGHGSLDKAGFFYARRDNSGSVPPCRRLMALLPLWCSATGKAEPSFYFRPYQTSFSEMHYTEKEGLKGKHSTCTPAKRGCKRAYKPLFEAEKAAKNRAYSYILTTRQFDDFSRYSRLTAGMDHHAICVADIVAKHFPELKTLSER